MHVLRSTTPSATSVTSASSSYPPGTIAALALSGILLFILTSLALCYLFVWRPRARRKRRERRTIKQLDRDSGEIVVIRQEKNDAEPGGGRVRDVFPLQPKNTGLTERGVTTTDAFDAPPFRFSLIGKVKALTNSWRTNTSHSQSHRASHELPSTVSARRSGSDSLHSIAPPDRDVLVISSVPHHPRSDRSRDTPDRRPEVSAAEVRSHFSHEASSTPTSSQVCSDCRTDASIPSPDTQPHDSSAVSDGAQPSGSRRVSTASPKASEDDELEYADIEYIPDTDSNAVGLAQRSTDIAGALAEIAAEGNQQRSSQQSADARASDEDSFLRVRQSSPFRVDFPHHSVKGSGASGSQQAARTRLSGSRVRFQDRVESSAEGPSKPEDADDADRNVILLPPPPLLRPILQLTPPTATLPQEEGEITSFLDLTASPSGSLKTRSSSSSSRRNPVPERSRWSSTTTQSAYTNPSLATGTTGPGHEEFRWSIPTSPSRSLPFHFSIHAPHIRRHSRRQDRSSGSLSPRPLSLQVPTRVPHPFSLTETTSLPSPTHSVPTTISDLHFRHSESDDASRAGSRRASTGSHLPPHPPLPPLPGGFPEILRRQRERANPSSVNPALSNQPNIVQRVLGLQSQVANSPPPPPPTHGRTPSAGGSGLMSPSIPRIFRPG